MRKPPGYTARRTLPDGVAIVIPAYNEASTIRAVVLGALAFGAHVIVIDDGSLDGTGDRLADFDVTVLRNQENMGKAASLWRGFETVLARGYKAAVTLDADGQHDPSEIPRLITTWAKNPDSVVIGARQHGWQRHFSLRVIANKLADFCISWAAGQRILDTQSGFRVYPAELLRRIDLPHDKRHGFVFESEVLIAAVRLGYVTLPVLVTAVSRKSEQTSHFHPILDTCRIARMLWKSLCEVRFSLKSLQRILRHDESVGP